MTRWYLVPSEPTEGMVEAGLEYRYDSIKHGYAAMLAAAPDPSKEEEMVERVETLLKRGRLWTRDKLARAILSLFTEADHGD